MNLKERVKPWLIASLNDPITKIIAKNSHLSPVQLETLLIDVLSENMAGNSLKYDEKARLRLTKAEISRGPFNRTLAQAKNNVIRSIYTILLLGYLGIFESTTLDPYVELANKLHSYLEAYKDMPNEGASAEEHLKLIETVRNELELSLKQLGSPSKSES